MEGRSVARVMRGALWALAAVSTGAQRPLERDLLRELVEINTATVSGTTTPAAEAMARRLRAAEFPEADVRVDGPNPRKANLVVRLRGAPAARPLLFLAHLDVVEARREDWSFDPFKLLERDGYYYGRGTLDNKAGAAGLVAVFLRWKQEGFRPSRDFIMALTADEEGGDFNGVDWLLKNHRDWIDSEYCVNTDSGMGELRAGKQALLGIQTAEKTYHTVRLEATSPGGHSSLPVPDNAIYRLARGLDRLAQFQFPVKLSDTTRAFLEVVAGVHPEVAGDLKALLRNPADAYAAARLGESAYFNAQMRTTCIATMLEAGHAENALPQTARATVNCRLLPGESPAEVERTLARVLADDKISVKAVRKTDPNHASPPRGDLMGQVRRAAQGMWPGVVVAPVMETGGTDGRLLRSAGIPAYGVSGLFLNPDDVRAHGKDERIGVEAYHESVEFLYRLGKELGGRP